MALSDHEQRMLDEIESALTEDTEFAQSVAHVHVGKGIVSHRRSAVVPWILIVAGIVLLVVGFLVTIGDFPLLSLMGFIAMFAGGVLLLKRSDSNQTFVRVKNFPQHKTASRDGANSHHGSGLAGKFYERFDNRE